jgi:DNA-directed RNA polymerase subunit RPC12/RpoP
MPAKKCMKCGAELTSDEIGLHLKLVNRGSTEFMCKNCLSKHFDIPLEKLDELVIRFREMGCSLF